MNITQVRQLAERHIRMVGQYTNARTRTSFTDVRCGHVWEATPDSVLRGAGCPKRCNRMKLVHGVGINDLRVGAQDPCYVVWKSMIGRCFGLKVKVNQPTYDAVYCVDAWKTFSVFKEWMVAQQYEGKQLDKDLLVPGNRIYGPAYCLFVTPEVNTAVKGDYSKASDLPRGVNRNGKKFSGEFQKRHLGTFETSEDAHNSYLQARNQWFKALAATQTDFRVRNALLMRTL